MTTAPEHARPVRLARRSGQGVVMGLDPWQLAFLTAAAVILLIFVNRFGPLGLLYGAPFYLGFGVTALTSIHGISTPRMGGLWLMKQVRHGAGATTEKFRPEAPATDGNTESARNTRVGAALGREPHRRRLQPARPIRVRHRGTRGAGVPDARPAGTVRPRGAVRPGPRPVHPTPRREAGHPAGADPADHDPRRPRTLRHRPPRQGPEPRLPRRPQLPGRDGHGPSGSRSRTATTSSSPSTWSHSAPS